MEPKPMIYCHKCGEGIYCDDKVYEIDGQMVCDECAHNIAFNSEDFYDYVNRNMILEDFLHEVGRTVEYCDKEEYGRQDL